MGMHPELTGKGSGLIYTQAVLDFEVKTYQPEMYRVTIAAFNKRAQRVWEKAGFSLKQHFIRSLDGNMFIIFTRQRARND